MQFISQKWLVFIAAGIMVLLGNLDMTIVNLALPPIAKWAGAGLTEAQWLIVGYLLTTVIFFSIGGRVADLIGKRRVYLFGIALFGLTSLLAGLAPNMLVLIGARLLQGIGYAATLGLSFLIIVQTFPAEQRGFASGLTSTLVGLSQAAGPMVGGIILHFFSWRWVFLMNVPLCAISLYMCLAYVPPDELVSHKESLDYKGLSYFAAGLGILLVSLNEMAGLSLLMLIILLAVSALFLWLFVHHSLKIKCPLIDVNLLTHRGYVTILVVRLFFMFSMIGLLFIIPLYLQNILGLNSLYAGLLMLCMTALVAVASFITGKILDKKGFKGPIFASMIIAAISCLMMHFLQPQLNIMLLVVSLLCFGIATGIHIPATIDGALKQASAKNHGAAIGLFFTIAMLGGSMGVAISGSIINLHSHTLLTDFLTSHTSAVPANILLQAANGMYNVFTLPPQLSLFAQQSFIKALHAVLWLNFGLACLGALLTLTLPKLKH